MECYEGLKVIKPCTHRLIQNSIDDTIVFPGDYSGGETPEPIPNSAVKPSSVDDTTIGGKVERRQGFFFFS